VSASDKIARLRELSEQHWAASGPFKMPPNTPVEELSLFKLNRNFLAAAAVTLPALLECAEALDSLKITDEGIRALQANGPIGRLTIYVDLETASKARAALDALAGGGE
jgi:hypothetical protein